jgi:amino acid adenylation domain-containing protein
MSIVGDPIENIATERLRALLAERLLKAASQSRRSPLSFAQQRLWFLDQLEPNSPRYNMCNAARLRGKLNIPALEEALNAILSRHEALRTRIMSEDGEPAQIVDGNVRIEVPLIDLADCPEKEREQTMAAQVHQEVTRPFDLSIDRLFRALLLRLGREEHVLVINMHHIVSDEWSFNIFYKELVAFYSGFLEGHPARLAELPIQYSDYAEWQRDWLQGGTFDKQLAYWKEQLRGNPPGVDLPTDHPRRPDGKARGAARWLRFDTGMTQAVKRFANEQGATLFMVLLAGFKALLYRYTCQEDIIVGSPLAGRNRVETEDLIGFFVNTVALRATVSGEMTFQELLRQVKEVSLAAYSNQDLPFEKLVEVLQPDRSVNSTPFVKVMFFVQQVASGPLELPGLNVEFLEHGSVTAKFDVTLAVNDDGSNLTAVAQYNGELFDDSTIARFMEQYRRLLESVVEQPLLKISGLPLLSDEERQHLLVDWNNTATEYPRTQPIHALFEEKARTTPEAAAVTFGSNHLTYRVLNERANQLAHYLKSAGVGPFTRVAICGERSLELIIGLLGILKAGAAYASLDPGLPLQRLAVLLDDLRPEAFILTHSRCGEHIPGHFTSGSNGPVRICLETEWSKISSMRSDDLGWEVRSEDLAYISFTSGSTGRPKGVCVPHRAVVRLVRDANYANFSADEVFLQMAPVAFDASTFEIWGALLNGARLVVLPPHLPSLSELAETIQKERVTTAWFTSGFFNQIVDEQPEALKPLRQVLTGGDVLSPLHIKKALSIVGASCRIINGYGPTENTTFTACYAVPPLFDGSRAVPIGRPIANTTCFILDEHLQPVPIGFAGQLYAGGDGMANGYWNAPELTAQRFIPNPFQPGTRLYKTGDRARYLPDGNIEFLGRTDLQVKIRGFRVELGEIEAVLAAHPGVRQCVVSARADASGTKQLVAYIVPMQFPAPQAWELQGFLQERLPEYMVPSFVAALRSLPLTSNGKVDHSALPVPGLGNLERNKFSPPSTETERQLQELWEQVLNVRPIGIRDKFFALGGHSLLVVRLLARIEKVFGQRLTVAAFFQNPTIEQLAKLLNRQTSIQTEAPSSIVAIQPDGGRVPLFLVHGVGGGMFWGYSNLARHLGKEQPIYAFKSRGLEGQPEFESIEEMAESYLADLRRLRPQGPYYLGGYCFGGLVAYEMARRLQAEGEKVPVLAVINSNPPNSCYTRFRWTLPLTYRWAKNVSRRTLVSLQTRPGRLCAHLCYRTRGLVKRLVVGRGESTPDINDYLDLSQYTEEQRKVWATHARALVNYFPGDYPGNLTLFRSPVHLMFCSFERDYGWGDHVQGKVTVRIIPGMHETIIEEPNVARLASEVESCLRAATESAHQ